MRIILLYLLRNFRFSLSENQKKLMKKEYLTYNDFTMGPRNIYNDSLENNNLGMYVNIEFISKSKL